MNITPAEAFVFGMASFGMTFTLVYSEAGTIVRWALFKLPILKKMIVCMFCTGFWVGIVFALAVFGRLPNTYHEWRVIVVYGFISAAFSYILDLVTKFLELYMDVAKVYIAIHVEDDTQEV